MISFLVVLRGLGKALLAVWRDPETRGLPVIVGALLLSGTLFYWTTEDWTFIESLYFSVVTLTTVGYGDLTPTSDYSRLFTIVYIFVGLGVLVAFVSSLAQHYMRQRADESERALEHLRAIARHEQPPEDGGTP